MNVKLKEKPEFLNINLSGAFQFDRLIEFVVELGKKKQNKFLIDASKLENTDLSYKQRYDIGNTAVIYLDQNRKYGVVWPERDINYFAISVMKLHGFNIQIFPDMTSAKKWLL